MADRAARDWEALTPQGNALRDAENYLTAYSFVQNGANQWHGSLGAFGANAFMTPGWQALRYAQNSLGYEQQSPASVDALIAGYAGAYDAFNYPPIGTSGCGCGAGSDLSRHDVRMVECLWILLAIDLGSYELLPAQAG